MNKHHYNWIVLVSKSFYNRENIITKYQIIVLNEKFFKFILAIAKETYLIILVEKNPPF